MDLSPLIFVALAVAWVTYLVPKAIRHHDEVNRSRSVERFSATMRVLARREAVGSRDSRLVLSPGRARSTSVVTTKETLSVERGPAPAAPADPTPVGARTTRTAAARRRRVLGVVLALLALVVVLAATGLLGWAWTVVPATLLVAWLVACRLMVRASSGRARTVARRTTATSAVEDADEEEPEGETTQEVAVVVAQAVTEETAARAPLAPGMWDPVPMTLPTYVDKAPAARRTVRTIDLDSSGVWTSGHSEVDSALAREAEEAERAARAEELRRSSEQRRATGS